SLSQEPGELPEREGRASFRLLLRFPWACIERKTPRPISERGVVVIRIDSVGRTSPQCSARKHHNEKEYVYDSASTCNSARKLKRTHGTPAAFRARNLGSYFLRHFA